MRSQVPVVNSAHLTSLKMYSPCEILILTQTFPLLIDAFKNLIQQRGSHWETEPTTIQNLNMSGQFNQQYSKVSTDSEGLLSEDNSHDSSEDLLEKSVFSSPQKRRYRNLFHKGAVIGGIISCAILLLGLSFAAGRASVGLTECGKRLSPWCKIPEAIRCIDEQKERERGLGIETDRLFSTWP